MSSGTSSKLEVAKHLDAVHAAADSEAAPVPEVGAVIEVPSRTLPKAKAGAKAEAGGDDGKLSDVIEAAPIDGDPAETKPMPSAADVAAKAAAEAKAANEDEVLCNWLCQKVGLKQRAIDKALPKLHEHDVYDVNGLHVLHSTNSLGAVFSNVVALQVANALGELTISSQKPATAGLTTSAPPPIAEFIQRLKAVRKGAPCTKPPNDEADMNLRLQDWQRKDVYHDISLHNMYSVDGCIQLHLVLKFRYNESCIKLFGGTKPENNFKKTYGDADRLFPYCIFNSIGEETISWTYENKKGEVYERVELMCTVTSVQYMRYYPFVIRVLCLKVGTDGTAQTGMINLLPKLKKDEKGKLKKHDGGNVPDVDIGVFKKVTSAYRIAKVPAKNGEKAADDVACRMVVRQLVGDSANIYPRIYTAMFFMTPWLENFATFIIFSTIMLHLTMFLPKFELDAIIGTVLAVALTEVALLFVMPNTDEFTTAETVVVVQALYVIIQAFVVGLVCDDGISETEVCVIQMWHILIANTVVTVCTAAWCVYEYRSYKRLVKKIKSKFIGDEYYEHKSKGAVTSYPLSVFKNLDEIDGQI